MQLEMHRGSMLVLSLLWSLRIKLFRESPILELKAPLEIK